MNNNQKKDMFTKRQGDVYYCDTSSKQLELVAQPFIARLNRITLTAGTLALSIKNDIIELETKERNREGYVSEDEVGKKITRINDVTYKFVSIGRWRKGFGFVVLQLSNLNGGNARLSAYVTDTVHHTGEGIGTIPEYAEGMEIVSKYLANSRKVKNDIALLKAEHQTVKSVDELYETIKI